MFVAIVYLFLTKFVAAGDISPSPSKKSKRSSGKASAESKKSRALKPELAQEWRNFGVSVSKFEVQQEQVKNSFAFSFVEGALVKAIKKVPEIVSRN